MLHGICECTTGIHDGPHATGAARQAQPYRPAAKRTDPRVMAGKDIGKPVMAIAIIAFHAFRRALEYHRRLAREVCEAPTVVQGFEFEILIAESLADGHQFLAQRPDLVEPTVAS